MGSINVSEPQPAGFCHTQPVEVWLRMNDSRVQAHAHTGDLNVNIEQLPGPTRPHSPHVLDTLRTDCLPHLLLYLHS